MKHFVEVQESGIIEKIEFPTKEIARIYYDGVKDSAAFEAVKLLVDIPGKSCYDFPAKKA